MKYVLVFIVSWLLIGCLSTKGVSQKRSYQKLINIESKLVNKDLSINSKKAKKLYRSALAFNQRYPSNKNKEAVYVFAAKSSDGLNWNKENIKIIDTLLSEFPNSKQCPVYLFNKGKIYEEKLHDIEKAKMIYKKVVKLYPNSIIAKNLIDYLAFISKSEQEKNNF